MNTNKVKTGKFAILDKEYHNACRVKVISLTPNEVYAEVEHEFERGQ